MRRTHVTYTLLGEERLGYGRSCPCRWDGGPCRWDGSEDGGEEYLHYLLTQEQRPEHACTTAMSVCPLVMPREAHDEIQWSLARMGWAPRCAPLI